ncbi:hypothetical protein PATSB16_17570 [Pandoraea thiooxydans]|uniref:ApeI dehydratase-like domain-containing protein n=1 Tax=Pandoraea thiooxydans TaxID=445709 RepID=A0A0G3ETA9_9BURK|nr:hypothetical protein [Pandoraea thiooxydans]AKJ67901.1 hypothetical protein ABW99_06385 [Pandoraea thiooxydans]APR95099.1 hypothetical protein PATSB16_17570 [Pandoraea thiooxydans]
MTHDATAGGARYAVRDVVRSDHGAIPGHFPEQPVVPAVVILERVMSALAAWNAGARVVHIDHAKFMHVLRPDQAFTITLAREDDAHLRFECTDDDGTRVAAGKCIVQGLAL